MRVSSRVPIFSLIIVSCVVYSCGHSHRGEVQEDEKWLDDFDTNMDEMMGDSPWTGVPSVRVTSGECPPVSRDRSAISCVAATCKTDNDCAEINRKCCSNGCVHTCLKSVQNAGYVDWRNEPRKQQGSAWLVTGPDDSLPVEWCSTSAVEEDEDALMCPHGYICHLEYLGNPEKGEPNRGRCLKENDQTGPLYRKFRLKTEDHESDVCMFENAIFADGSSFLFHQHSCVCKNQMILCHVGRTTSRPTTPETSTEPDSREP